MASTREVFRPGRTKEWLKSKSTLLKELVVS
jgi:hypothetical protein